jgi:hypothetical protein
LEGNNLNSGKERFLQVVIEDKTFGISTSLIESIRELKNVSLDSTMNECTFQNADNSQTSISILNSDRNNTQIRYDGLNFDRARIIFIIEATTQKIGALIVNSVTNLFMNTTNREIPILDITNLFIT